MRLRVLALMFAIVSVAAAPAVAQCPMCKKNVETHLQGQGQVGAGLNTGILYLLAIPYAMVGTVAYLWWRRQRRMQAAADYE